MLCCNSCVNLSALCGDIHSIRPFQITTVLCGEAEQDFEKTSARVCPTVVCVQLDVCAQCVSFPLHVNLYPPTSLPSAPTGPTATCVRILNPKDTVNSAPIYGLLIVPMHSTFYRDATLFFSTVHSESASPVSQSPRFGAHVGTGRRLPPLLRTTRAWR